MTMLHYTLILHRKDKDDMITVKCLVNSLQQQDDTSSDNADRTMGADSVLVSFCPVDQNFEVVDAATDQWTALKAIDMNHVFQQSHSDSPHHQTVQPPENVTKLPDYLHNLADHLPYAGFTLDVYLINPNMKKENCIYTVGALLRLCEWHAGQVKVVGQAEEGEDSVMLMLATALHAVVLQPGQLTSHGHRPVWRGPLMWPGQKGFMQQGLSLQCEDHQRLKDKLSDLHFWNCNASRKGGGEEGGDRYLVFGQQIEVLTYVSLHSVPLYLIDDFSLHLACGGGFLIRSHVNAGTQFGQLAAMLTAKDALLMRIALYEKWLVPTAWSHGLCTSAWKDGIAASERPSPDPEKEPLPCRQHLFLMLCGDKDLCPPYKVTVLRSPSEVNPCLLEEIHRFSCLDVSHYDGVIEGDNDKKMDRLVQNLPLLTAADFHRTDAACLQSAISCINTQKSLCAGDGDFELRTSQVVRCAREGQEMFLQQGQTQHTSCSVATTSLTHRHFVAIPDLECAPSEWPERRAWLDKESKTKVLRRYHSSDSFSLMLSSPLAPEESSMDAKDMVKWFKPDGSAVLDDLSPVKPAVRTPRVSSLEEGGLVWPACKDLCYHDVYYEHNKKSEKQEKFFQKFRDNILLEESHNVCSRKPHVPALRYRNRHNARSQMDVSCGGSKLTPITRTLSPASMLQATPSTKKRLAQDQRWQDNSGQGRKTRTGKFAKDKHKITGKSPHSKRKTTKKSADDKCKTPRKSDNKCKTPRKSDNKCKTPRKSADKCKTPRKSADNKCKTPRKSADNKCKTIDKSVDDKKFSAPKAAVQERSVGVDGKTDGTEKQCVQSPSFSAPKGRVRKGRSAGSEGHQHTRVLRKERSRSMDHRQSDKDDSSQSDNSCVFYPRKADLTLPPFRRVRQDDMVSISSMSSPIQPCNEASSDRTVSLTRCRFSSSSSSEEDVRRSSESLDSATSGCTDTDQHRFSRSKKHKRSLEKIVWQALEERGVTTNNTLYASSFSQLFKVTKFYIKQLPNSRNLKAEMMEIAKKQVEQVVDMEGRRQDLAVINKLRKRSSRHGNRCSTVTTGSTSL